MSLACGSKRAFKFDRIGLGSEVASFAGLSEILLGYMKRYVTATGHECERLRPMRMVSNSNERTEHLIAAFSRPAALAQEEIRDARNNGRLDKGKVLINGKERSHIQKNDWHNALKNLGC